MKKQVLMAIVFSALMALNALNVLADVPKEKEEIMVNAANESQLTTVQFQQMVARVHEIQKMDKNGLTLEQRKELKTELTTMKVNVEKEKVMRHHPVVFVISGAALVLIIVLLIVLL
jgi:hypothetical protein